MNSWRLDAARRSHTLTSAWSRVLVEKLKIARLVKTFLSVCGNRIFIIIRTRNCHRSLSADESSSTSVLILYFNIIFLRKLELGFTNYFRNPFRLDQSSLWLGLEDLFLLDQVMWWSEKAGQIWIKLENESLYENVVEVNFVPCWFTVITA